MPTNEGAAAASAGSFWFRTLDGEAHGVTRYWMHKRLAALHGWRGYRIARGGVIYRAGSKYPLGEWGVI